MKKKMNKWKSYSMFIEKSIFYVGNQLRFSIGIDYFKLVDWCDSDVNR